MTYLAGVGVVGVGLAGAVLVARLVSRVRLDSDCCLANTASVILVIKKIAVKTAVKRVKKLAEPDAPNTVAEPLHQMTRRHRHLCHVEPKSDQSLKWRQ